MTRPLLDSEWTRCFLLLTFDKSIRNRMILTWITVDGGQVVGQAPPEGLSSLLSPGLLIVISTSQLLLKTSIKFYNGSHLWFNINRALQRKIENSNERKERF